RLVLSLSLAGLTAGVLAAESWSPPTTEAFLNSIHAYPYVAAAGRREKIRTGVPELKRCMSAAAVRRLIGDPDFGYVAFRAGSGGQVPTSHHWNYVLEKKAATEIDPSSQVVIWFDGGGKLQTVAVHGAPDIQASISRRNDACPT